MKRFALSFAFLLLVQNAWAQQDAASKLEKKVQEVAEKVTNAFVFFPGGSGFFISADGYALTNHHVAGSQKSCRVTLSDGRNLKATNICTDAVGDVALFKVEGLEDEVPFLTFADSDKVQVGQYCVAVGNPFGLAAVTPNKRWYPSVSLGIVSAMHRYQQQYSDCIQTDAAVNPGNSGGPLVNLKGELLGINGRIATRYFNRVNSGVGYAIAANQIRNFLPQMKKGGKDGKIYHGQVNGLTFGREHQHGKGALVSAVKSDSTAEKAGFEKDDLIVAVNEYSVFSTERFLGVIGTYPEETEVKVRVIRDGREVVVPVALDRYQGADIMGMQPRREPQGGGYLGVTIEDREEGVQVTYVNPGSPADDAGLKENDLILAMDDKPVKDRVDLVDRIGSKKPGAKVTLKIKRGGEDMTITATLGKRP